jgi:hypothetical protein
MMPAMMMSDAPLPMPYSVMSSPIHMTRIAPAVRPSTTNIAMPKVGAPPPATMPGSLTKTWNHTNSACTIAIGTVVRRVHWLMRF